MRILVTDDDEMIRCLIHDMLAPYNDIEVDFCHTAEEAQETIQKKHYDWLVTDYQMPGINGAQLTKWVRERYDIRIILITGYADCPIETNDIEKIIAKPFEANKLIKTLRSEKP